MRAFPGGMGRIRRPLLCAWRERWEAGTARRGRLAWRTQPRKITSGVGPQNVPHVPPVGARAAVPNERNLPAIGGWQRAGAPASRTFPSCLGGCDLAGSGSILTTALADLCCSLDDGYPITSDLEARVHEVQIQVLMPATCPSRTPHATRCNWACRGLWRGTVWNEARGRSPHARRRAHTRCARAGSRGTRPARARCNTHVPRVCLRGTRFQ